MIVDAEKSRSNDRPDAPAARRDTIGGHRASEGRGPPKVAWVIETAKGLEGTGHHNEKLTLVIPTTIGRHDGSGRPGLFDSVIQSAWSFMVALRARGLGTVWTTMYLNEADAVAELLGIPDHMSQICLFPVAYTKGVDFSPTSPRYPAREIAYFDRFGHTRASAGVVAEVDIKAEPDLVQPLLDAAGLDLRFVLEPVPGGSRLRAHTSQGDHHDALERLLAGIKDRAEQARRESAQAKDSGFPRLGKR